MRWYSYCYKLYTYFAATQSDPKTRYIFLIGISFRLLADTEEFHSCEGGVDTLVVRCSPQGPHYAGCMFTCTPAPISLFFSNSFLIPLGLRGSEASLTPSLLLYSPKTRFLSYRYLHRSRSLLMD